MLSRPETFSLVVSPSELKPRSDKAGFVIHGQVKVNFDAPDRYFQGSVGSAWDGRPAGVAEASSETDRVWYDQAESGGGLLPETTVSFTSTNPAASSTLSTDYNNAQYGLRLVQFTYRDRITTKVDGLLEPLSRPNSKNWTNLLLK